MSIYKTQGETANTTQEHSAFAVLNERVTFDKKIPKAEDIVKGRPLWLTELRK